MTNITFTKNTSPYIRKETSTKRMMFDVLIALIPITIFTVYKFGLSSLIKILISLIVFVLVELIYFLATTKATGFNFKERFINKFSKYTINHISAPLVSGLIYVFLLPDQISLYVVVMGALFGSLVGKMIFGGLGSNLFNPAALGRVFVGVAFAGFFTGSYGFVDAGAGATALGTEFPGVLNSYSILDLLIGNIPGSLGEINAILILIGAAYLFIRRSADFRPALVGLLTFTLFITVAGFFLHPDYLIEFVLYHVLSGGLLFGLSFMITDPATSPVTRPGRVWLGFIVGFIIFSIRIFGNLPEGVAFAILFGNLITPLIDYPKWSTNLYKKRFFISFGTTVVLLIGVVALVLGGIF
ncbi:MAG: RnfABCDGE type electron transport complex subunit D [Acholeplasmataceae bacterium]